MAIDSVTLGQATTIQAQFLNPDNTPFVVVTPPTFTITDFNNRFVTSGTGQQDNVYPERWTAQVTIPSSAPFDPVAKYSIKWIAQGSNNSINTYNEYFNVRTTTDYQFEEIDRSALEFGPVTDSLVLPTTDTVTTYTVRIIDTANSIEIYNSTNNSPSPIMTENAIVYSFTTSALSELSMSFTPYLIEWTYTVNGIPRKEYHALYVFNNALILLLSQLRQMIDKGRFSHPNPNLRYNDADLIFYLLQGAQIVNATKPTFTNYNISSFPQALNYYLLCAAAYVGLSAQYLAEGQAAFELSGQSVSLNIDRTASIDSAIGRYQDIIQNQLPTAKKMAVLSSGAGVLGVTNGPTANYNFYVGPYSGRGGFPGDLVSRNLFYTNAINGLISGF